MSVAAPVAVPAASGIITNELLDRKYADRGSLDLLGLRELGMLGLDAVMTDLETRRPPIETPVAFWKRFATIEKDLADVVVNMEGITLGDPSTLSPPLETTFNPDAPHRKMDEFDLRVEVKHYERDHTFTISKKDLYAWDGGLCKDPATGKFSWPANTPCISSALFAPDVGGALVGDRAVVLFADIRMSPDAQVPHDFVKSLKAGCSLASDFLAFKAHVMQNGLYRDPVVADFIYFEKTNPGKLTFQLDFETLRDEAHWFREQARMELLSKLEDKTEQVNLPEVAPPPLSDIRIPVTRLVPDARLHLNKESRRLARCSMLEDSALTRGTLVYVHKASGIYYRIVPDSHGMADFMRKNAEKLFSKALVYTGTVGNTQTTPVYFRVRETTFQMALELFREQQANYSMVQHLRNIRLYMGLAHGRDENGVVVPLSLPSPLPADFETPYRITLRLSMLVYQARPPKELLEELGGDVFLADPREIHAFLPGLKYLDPVAARYHTDPDTNKRVALIPSPMPLRLKEYLTERKTLRSAIKRGLPTKDKQEYISNYLGVLETNIVPCAYEDTPEPAAPEPVAEQRPVGME